MRIMEKYVDSKHNCCYFLNIETGATNMTALDWIRNKAEIKTVETFKTENGETYRVTMSSFCGTLPSGMAAETRKMLGSLVSSDLETETLVIGGQYRSDYGRCEYVRNVYERVG